MNYKATSSRWFELNSQQGRSPTVVPDAAASTKIQFLLNALPTQKDSKFWYYLEAAWLRLSCTMTLPADSAFAGMRPEWLYQALSSVEIQSPLLGTLFATQNTRGSVLGNVIQPVAFGYNSTPKQNLLGAGGNTTIRFHLYYRIPFAHNFLANRMDTAPWVGLLEGGFVNVNVAPSGAFAGALAGSALTSVTASVALAMQPEAEPRIHTPVQWREHQCPGGGTRFTIPDMGSPDGLQGIDQSKGVGIAFLGLLTGPAATGLTAGVNALQISSYNIPWRDQPEIYNAELPYLSLMEAAAAANRQPGGSIAALTDMNWPHVLGTVVPNGDASGANFFNSPGAMIFPLIVPGADQYTSKLQTVAGAKDINFGFSSVPSAQQRFVGCYFPQFDEQFAQSLAARIAPGSEGVLKAKMLDKQEGVLRGQGKAAYTPDKIVA